MHAPRLCLVALLTVSLARAGGLTPDERAKFYHLSEGSEIFPVAWARALESSKTKKPFLEDLERFGLIPDADGPAESGFPGGKLPVGMTVHVPRGLTVRMLGINCAACHVNELRRGNKTVRVDGAPNLVDMAGLYGELVNSFLDTLKDRKRLIAFLKRLAATEAEDRATRLLLGLLPALEAGAKDSPAWLLIEHLRARLGGDEDGADDAVRGLLERSPRGLLDAARERLERRAKELKELAAKLAAETALAKLLKDAGPDTLPLLEGRLAQLRRLKTLHAPGGNVPENGPGRVDAFGSARNLLFSPEDAVPPDAPVRMPRLYGLSKNRWLHWDGNTNSVMERNIGQALGLGGVVAPKTDVSTLLPVNLHRLEQLARKLEPPAWPEAFGKVEETSDEYKAGKALYGKHCASCHDDQKGGRNVGGAVVYDVGTDPRRASNFAREMADRSLGKTFPEAIAKRIRAIKVRMLTDHKEEIERELGEDERKKLDLPDAAIVWQAPGGYVARPLAGVWAAAPYLHNGSVPTLDDLLRPAKERPMVFPVGHREYDPAKVGFVSDLANVPEEQRSRAFLFDTRIEGNRNTGHEYPKKPLEKAEREALLTYLKTLR